MTTENVKRASGDQISSANLEPQKALPQKSSHSAPGFSPVLNGKGMNRKCDGPFTGLKPGENEKTFKGKAAAKACHSRTCCEKKIFLAQDTKTQRRKESHKKHGSALRLYACTEEIFF